MRAAPDGPVEPNHDEERPDLDRERPDLDGERLDHDWERLDRDRERPNHDRERPDLDGERPNHDRERLDRDEKSEIYVHAAVIPPRASVCPSPAAGTQSLNRSILACNENGAYTDGETSP